MPDPIPEFLAGYLEQRDAQRADAVNTFLASLTERECRLIRDIAVMGYVRGRMHPQGEEHPKDSAVLAEVADACLAFPDLYPAVNADYEEQRQTIEYFVQGQQPDGTWEQASSTTTDPEFVVQRLSARRRAQPEFAYRIARRTTTVLIEAQQPEAEETDGA
ncbi:hypothetical protein [Streptomyces lydicamycinicus]|uniref:hypothetical protein n=1 Tax=Streptomyces lydicamycinicus TaxID=1546107 RepID=UPI003C2C738E